MTACTTAMTMATNDHLIAKDENIDESNNSVSQGKNIAMIDAPTSDSQHCFVCDVPAEGRYYSLATCRTQSTRSRVIEKLGQLVGDRYIVVISDDDIICRSCANLMNTLDRLEFERKNVRNTILHYIECKYSLEEGELTDNSEIIKPCQPPQITKSHMPNGKSQTGKKRPAVCPLNVSTDETRQKNSNNTWMQCDKCLYTTKYNAFMVHHIRQHGKQQTSCDKCGVQLTPQQTIHTCKKKVCRTDLGNVQQTDKITGGMRVNPMVNTETKAEGSQAIVIDSNSHLRIDSKQHDMELIQVTSVGDFHLQNLVATGPGRSANEVYVRALQHVDNNEVNFQEASVVGAGTDLLVKVRDSTTKQMLTLAEDGSLEMVEVANWDDVHPSHTDSNIPF